MDKIKIDPWIYIWASVLLFLVPLRWLLSAAAAAAWHELCHLLAIRFMGCKAVQIRIGIFGASIRTGPMSAFQELICALAGPAGSLLLLVLFRLVPEIALCSLLQGAFNLLPVYPLDGGRAVRSVVFLVSKRPEQRVKWVEMGILILLAAIGIAVSFIWRLGLMLPVWFFFLTGTALLRKIPCKQCQQALQ